MKEFGFDEILSLVQKPGRYTGGEWNAVRKDLRKVKIKIALIFPDLYEVGMSYLGQKILYFILNSKPSFLADRVFAPWLDFEKELENRDLPLFSLDHRIPLPEFDILGFSLLYELNYSNILTILKLGKIPLFAAERSFRHPLVLAGGPAVFNPEPVADIFDAFLVGDGEEAFLEIAEKFMELRKGPADKEVMLKELAKIKGVYVPSLYLPHQPWNSPLFAVKPLSGAPATIAKRVLFPFEKAPFPEKIVVPNIKVIFDRVAVELARGCPQKCRFCQAASIYFPPRMKDPRFVVSKLLKSLHQSGYEAASLAALSVSDYPYLEETVRILMESLEKQNVSLSLPSLRPAALTPGLAESILRVRKTGFTLVPEAGTERLRSVINKNLSDQDIWEAAKIAFSRGWNLLKLYFMIGLPTEKEEDIEGIIAMVREIIRIGKAISKKAAQVNLTISPFIPKPHTSFQWLGLEEEESLKEKISLLQKGLKPYPSVKLKIQALKCSILEAVFSRGDRRLSKVLLAAWQNGARFDSWDDLFDFGRWERAFASQSLDYRIFLSSLPLEASLPWDHIDSGIKKSLFQEDLERARQGERSAPCLEKVCSSCLGCTFWPQYEKKFPRKPVLPAEKLAYFGQKSERPIRYRIFYSKLNSARYISHIDLNNILQRALRRAGVSVVHTRGFHPIMSLVYPPALPLGMEGKEEAFEFQSFFLFPEEKFINHLNQFLPPGVRFNKMQQLETSQPQLNDAIDNLVYSVDLGKPEVEQTLEARQRQLGGNRKDLCGLAQSLAVDYLKNCQNPSLLNMRADSDSEKVYLCLKFSPQRVARPQAIVEEVFGLKNPVYAMAREKIVFKGSDSAPKLTKEGD